MVRVVGVGWLLCRLVESLLVSRIGVLVPLVLGWFTLGFGTLALGFALAFSFAFSFTFAFAFALGVLPVVLVVGPVVVPLFLLLWRVVQGVLPPEVVVLDLFQCLW